MKRPRYIASCSGGKDSVATILLAAEKNEPLDEVIYSEVMFDQEISGEVPEHRDFIHQKLKRFVENELGCKFTVLRSDKTYDDVFHHIITRSYVGIALDEPKRLARLNKEKDISLLAKYGMTEADAWRLCEKYDMLSPCYQHSKRNGCWFCPNASTSELSHMVNRHPDLFEKLIEWEHTDNLYHRRLTRTETPSEIKARLSGKSQPEFSISNQ